MSVHSDMLKAVLKGTFPGIEIDIASGRIAQGTLCGFEFRAYRDNISTAYIIMLSRHGIIPWKEIGKGYLGDPELFCALRGDYAEYIAGVRKEDGVIN